MSRLAGRGLAALLAVQQLSFGLPAGAEVDLQAGRPTESGALSGSAAPRVSGIVPNLLTGEAGFRLPIVVPPGTGGFTPRVALAYGSSGRSGAIGVGWSLEIGPAVIARSTRRGAPEYDASKDEFELQGVRLRETGEPGRYVTERYAPGRIEWFGTDASPGHWRVLSPDGTRRYYGSEYAVGGPTPNLSRLDSSTVESVAPTVSSCPPPWKDQDACDAKELIIPSDRPFAWYLDRIEDRNGNVIQLFWGDLGDAGTRYLTEIRYSGHVGGAVGSVPDFGGVDDGTLAKKRRISFSYEARPDVLPSFRSGFRQEVTKRLAGIDVTADAATADELVRRYLIEYTQSEASGRSLLEVVRDLGASTQEAGALVYQFDYGVGGAVGWSAAPDPRWALPEESPGQPLHYVASGTDQGIRLADVNGDGYPDVVRGKGGARETFLGGPDGFAAVPDPSGAWDPPADFVDALGYTGLVFGDFDGDRRLDLIGRRILDNGRPFSGALQPDLTWGPPPPAPCTPLLSPSLENGPEAGNLQRESWRNSGSGWVAAPENDRDPDQLFLENAINLAWPYESCPMEGLPTSWTAGNGASYDVATRIADINGDGLSDLVYKRRPYQVAIMDQDTTPPEQGVQWQIFELRHGSLLNTGTGLQNAELNHYHWTEVYQYGIVGYQSSSPFDAGAIYIKPYDRPRWQFPQRELAPPAGFTPWLSSRTWSEITTCTDPGFFNAATTLVVTAFSGNERLVDVNADGLPDVLEATENDDPELANPIFHRAWINNGYGWQDASAGPEAAATPTESFNVLTNPVIDLVYSGNDVECLIDSPGGAVDQGWRVVDVNGDGGPDWIGGPGGEVRLWDARAPAGSLWRADGALGWALPAGIGFGVGSADASAVRLADVDNDGLLDIVVEAGAYLNLSEPPDRLETVSNPFGATTTLYYSPSSAFEDPPGTIAEIDGQVRAADARWVVDRVEVDPGFGQPVMVQELAYFGPVYDLEDREFRGFQRVDVVGPSRPDPGSPGDFLTRPLRRSYFHTSDALVGRVARSELFDTAADPGNEASWHRFRELHAEYVFARGDDAEPTYVDSSFDEGPVPAAFTAQESAFQDFFALVGVGPDADRSFLAFEVGGEERVFEGEPTSLDTRGEIIRDLYGNALEVRRLGDAADPGDDVTALATYAVLDDGSVLVASFPESLTISGTSGPAGTTLQRESRFFYDGSSQLGAITRGNATRFDRKRGADWVSISATYDVYGNPLTASEPYTLGGSDPITTTRLVFDADYQTFPLEVFAADGTPIQLAYQIEYDGIQPAGGGAAAACGGPPALGAVCRDVDPNGQQATATYDRFGREVSRNGRNGSAVAMDYHDADRAGSLQRREAFVRWDPDGPASPLGDPEASTSEVFFDGLGRSLRQTRQSLDSAVAERTFAYDAAGRAAQATRWSFATPLDDFEFEYDALGRPIRLDWPDESRTLMEYAPRQVTVSDIASEVPGFLEADTLVRKRVQRTDGFGRLAEVHEFADPEGTTPAITSYTYDPFGSLAQIEDAVANDLSLCASATGCPVSRHRTQIFYDELGYRVTLDDPDTGVWVYDPDARGRVRSVTDPRELPEEPGAFTTLYDYDELDRLIGVDPPDRSPRVFTYGMQGEPNNGAGRLIRVDDEEGYEELGYDAAGNVSLRVRTIAGLSFEFEHEYDPLGRMIRTLYPDGEEVTWHFERRLLTRISSANGPYGEDYVGSTGYDALDQLASLDLGGSGAAAVVQETRSYDPLRATLTQIAAVGAGDPLVTLDYTADGFGRILGIDTEIRRIANQVLLENRAFAYQYDGLFRMTEVTGAFDTNPAVSSTLAYDYDALGNMLRKDYEALEQTGFPSLHYDETDRPHALSSVEDTLGLFIEFDHDLAGNVIEKRRWNGASWEATPIGYDAEGRLVSVGPDQTMGYGAGETRLRLTKGGETLLYPEPDFEYLVSQDLVNKHFFVGGRRVASSSRTWSAPAAASQQPFGWDPELPVAWVLGSAWAGLALLLLGTALHQRRGAHPIWIRVGSVTMVLILGPTMVASRCGGGGGSPTLGTHDVPVLFYVTDHLASTLLTVDATGKIQSRFLYLPFGDAVTSDGTPLHHRFTGGELDPTAFYALGARHYDPEVGRFLQPDTIVPDFADPQTHNRYAYALNNPVSLRDPTGRVGEGAGGGGGIPIPLPTEGFVDTLCAIFGGCDSEFEPAVIDVNYDVTVGESTIHIEGSVVPAVPLLLVDITNPHVEELRAQTRDAPGDVVDADNGCIPLEDCNGGDFDTSVVFGPLDVLGFGRLVFLGIGRYAVGRLAAKTGGAAAVRLGRAGEDLVRAARDIGPKIRIWINGRGRIPDGLTNTVLTEVKNVQSLSLTRQLRDFLDFAQKTGRRFDLYVRAETRLSGPLQDAIEQGKIYLRLIGQ